MINLVIAGFQKAGTTSLKNYLGEHPLIKTHLQKEMTFFSLEEEFSKGENQAIKDYYNNDIEGYTYLLAKHATLLRNETNVSRMKDYNPEMKIIVALRNPVERAYSSYLMELSSGTVNGSFDEVLETSFENYKNGITDWRYNIFVKLGEYYDSLNLLYKYFPDSSIYLVKIEDLYSDPEQQIDNILKFLGLPQNVDINYHKEHNTFKVQRSAFVAELIKKVVSERNILKKGLKTVLPNSWSYKMGEQLRSLNKKEGIKQPMSPFAKSLLDKHYKPYNESLYNEYKINYLN